MGQLICNIRSSVVVASRLRSVLQRICTIARTGSRFREHWAVHIIPLKIPVQNMISCRFIEHISIAARQLIFMDIPATKFCHECLNCMEWQEGDTEVCVGKLFTHEQLKNYYESEALSFPWPFKLCLAYASLKLLLASDTAMIAHDDILYALSVSRSIPDLQ